MTWRQNLILVFAGTYSAVWNNLGAFAFAALPATAAFALMFWAFFARAVWLPHAALLLFPVGPFLTTMLLNDLHRHILGPEQDEARFLRLVPGKRDWKAFGAMIVLAIVARLPIGLVNSFNNTAQPIVIIILSAGWIIVLVVLAPRLLLLFPAIATDEPRALNTAWQMSDGTVRYFWPVFISIMAIAVALFGGASALSDILATTLPLQVSQLFQALCFGFLLVLVYALMASLLAQLYAMKRPPQDRGIEEIFD